MATATNQFRPDYAVPPGWVLEERLEVQGISHAEFARRCGRSPKLISEIIAGKASLEPETALQFEKVLGVDASIWLGIESEYQLHRARESEAEEAAGSAEWVRGFPVKELAKRGAIRRPKTDADAVSELLAFFRVGSVDAWNLKYGLANVAYRHSPSFKSDETALATWLRFGEIEAEGQECADYSENRFKKALRKIRELTCAPIEQALPRSRQLCNQSGVALVLVKPLPKTALSGAAWWQSPRKAVIQLSARYKSDDHLWFSFFHEAAHILLHSKKSVFVDEVNGGDADLEAEANDWAANTLVPRSAWERFVQSFPRSELAVRAFAEEQGVSPGIVVGMLQHQGLLPWTHLNRLKIRLTWKDEV
jgi:addiction module HigA family antidote